MKKLIFLAAVTLPMLLQAGQYIGVHGGTDYLKRTNEANSGQKVGFKAGGVYGIQLSETGVRAEVEVSYRESHHRTVYTDAGIDQLESKRFRSDHAWAYMANLHYDINSLSMYSVVPYVGFGVGLSQNTNHDKLSVEGKSSTEKQRDTCFAYQGMLGFQYPVQENLKVNLGYCYHIGAAHQKNHSCSLGLVKGF